MRRGECWWTYTYGHGHDLELVLGPLPNPHNPHHTQQFPGEGVWIWQEGPSEGDMTWLRRQYQPSPGRVPVGSCWRTGLRPGCVERNTQLSWAPPAHAAFFLELQKPHSWLSTPPQSCGCSCQEQPRRTVEVSAPIGQTQTPHPVLDLSQGAGNQYRTAQEANSLPCKSLFIIK